MWKKVKIWPVGVGAISTFVFSAFFFLGRGPGRDLSITFAGYTNSAAGVPSASFVVSNAAPGVLFVSKTGIVQVKEADEWKDMPSTNTGVLPLLPKQTFIVTISRPRDCEAWRIFMTSGRPRTSLILRRIGTAYQQQPFQFEPLSYLLLAPVLGKSITYGEELRN
jgi:hypothetical protein